MDVTDSRTGKPFKLYPTEALNEELRKHWASQCAHPSTELRELRVAGGGIQRREQCLVCGARLGNSVKAPADGSSLTPDDESLIKDWEAQRELSHNEIIHRHIDLQEKERANYRVNYREYLRTEKWRKKRSKIMARAAGFCEGCGDREPSEVHHLTYDNVGDEFLFQLVALCGPCHERVHDKDFTELPCHACRYQSEQDGRMYCGIYHEPSYMALSFIGECGPSAFGYEPLK